ncbi:SgcJ/EcaC family oxidoreductase [Botrimarina sp.]|uniref:SgcJ/EcaC family oxidoreductase n=1 Tax=Botrimarina sp. TaxID=2795802 RepID=UPI0032EB93C9
MRVITIALLSCMLNQTAAAEPPNELKTAVSERFTGYLSAFNTGDAQSVVSFWTDDAVSIDAESGRRTSGRQALEQDFEAFFSEAPDARLVGQIDGVRPLRPDVVVADGTVTLFTPGSEPVPSAFTAVLVNEGGEWLIASSQESDLPSPPTPRDALEELAWLVGEWRDDTDAADVQTTVRWSPNESFLIRSFRADDGDGAPLEGTQVIGWDALAKQFRAWTFNSDGSFGEGTASPNGDDLLLRTSYVSADGVTSSATQVITRLDDDTLQVEKIGQTVDGVPLPNSGPVRVVRIAPEATADAGGQP